MEHQQGTWTQLKLFEAEGRSVRHGDSGEGGPGTATREEGQAATASNRERALTSRLMEKVCERENLNLAYKRVKANKGAPGIDGMTVEELYGWIKENKEELITTLLEGSYEPQPVKRVEVPKPSGGTQELGIPTVVDRMVQQAILRVLDPILDPTFSESSYGFRRGRNAHQALKRATEYVEEGREVVVDFDIAKFFDRVNHDVLMARVARHVEDKRLLHIIRRFLEAGVMRNGVCIRRYEGTPQGGPLSPLSANLVLDDLDKELERRGHCFCRYADDCNIYVRTKRAGERVMGSVIRFLEERLRLRVNLEKSAVAYVEERQFLGYRLLRGGRLGIAPRSLARAKQRIRAITRRNRGVSLGRMIQELNAFVSGWVTYFRHAACKTALQRLDGWIRRKLRCVRLKQCKRPKAIAKFLKWLGVPGWSARQLAGTGRGWWRKAGTPQAHQAMSTAWFRAQGLTSLSEKHAALQS
ncbi:MAG: group II intron reverse transcriptase/maturase [Anaerolineae bacterium]|jgi:RNA-directed DNA polymerase